MISCVHILYFVIYSAQPGAKPSSGELAHYSANQDKSAILTFDLYNRYAAWNPSGFMVGNRCILVCVINRVILRSPSLYWSHRYCARYISSSRPDASLPCILATYLNSGSPEIDKKDKDTMELCMW